jgi:hypothetical protein
MAQPGPVKKLAPKENKERFWKKKLQRGSRRPGSDLQNLQIFLRTGRH